MRTRFRLGHEFRVLDRDREFIRLKRWWFVYRMRTDRDKDRYQDDTSWKRHRLTQYKPKD